MGFYDIGKNLVWGSYTLKSLRSAGAWCIRYDYMVVAPQPLKQNYLLFRFKASLQRMKVRMHFFHFGKHPIKNFQNGNDALAYNSIHVKHPCTVAFM